MTLNMEQKKRRSSRQLVCNLILLTSTTFPSTAAQLLELTVSYYDDYSYKTTTVLPITSGLDSTSMVKGLLTGSRVRKDDGTLPLLTVNYFDKRARVIETVSDNHLGGVDRITNTYNFPGELLTSKKQHQINGSALVTTILITNTYDHVGRLLTTKKRVNTQVEILQSKLTYNEIGQLKKQATVDTVVTEQDYIGGIEYSKVGTAASTIERIATEEGFLLNSSGVYSYYYPLTDHLGNVRSVIKNDGTAAAAVLSQEVFMHDVKMKRSMVNILKVQGSSRSIPRNLYLGAFQLDINQRMRPKGQRKSFRKIVIIHLD